MGVMPAAKTWSADRVFYRGELVTFDGSLWQAAKDTGNAPGVGADWTCLAEHGRHARPLTIRGTYEPGASYQALDIVALNGGSFIARRDAPGECPGDGWQLLAKQGKPGERGARGEPGPQGPHGPRGEPGMTATTVKEWKLDRERYVATPIMTNGLEGAPLDLRPLFEAYHNESGNG
jgi:hypothetical protein